MEPGRGPLGMRPETPDDAEDRQTRRPPWSLWDRIKILVLLLGAFAVLFWSRVVSQSGESLALALYQTRVEFWWVLALAGFELIRQIHYFISEHWAGYHQFWTESVFGGLQASSRRMNDWTRFRVMRLVKWAFFLVIVSLVLGRLLGTHPVEAFFQLPIVIWNLLPLVFQIAFAMIFLVIQFVALFWFLSRGGVEVYFPEDIKTRFRDVWGQDHVLEKVQESIIYLETPEAIEARGGYVPGGILLWGPPGTGKTLMAEAVAGETGKPFVFVEPGAFINMFMGIGVLKVKSLFRKLRKLALRYGGVIAFFDEADALGSRGSAVAGQGGWMPGGAGAGELWSSDPPCNGLAYISPASASILLQRALPAEGPRPGGIKGIIAGMGMGGGGMGTLQALLTEMSGLKKPRGFINRIVRRAIGMRPKPPPKYRILMMMATNMPQALDQALLRPGRIDRIYRVGYPSKEGRVRTYEGYLAKVRHNLTPEHVDKLATITPYATGASIKDIVNEALINAIRENREWVTWHDIIKARILKSLGPPENVEYIERERHAVAVHEACHAVMAYRVLGGYAIDLATIEKGQGYLGFVKPIPLEEQFSHWRTEYEADILVSLASLAGEKMFFDGDNSSGVSGDLHNATSVAMLMEGYWGMGRAVGSHAASKAHVQGRGSMFEDGVDRNMLETDLGKRVEQLLGMLFERARRIIEENRYEVLAVAHALETRKTLTGDDIEAIIEGKPGPLVDGRVYKTDEFRRLADAYHERVVEAHKGHGKVDIPLPVLDGMVHSPTAAAMRSSESYEDARPRRDARESG